MKRSPQDARITVHKYTCIFCSKTKFFFFLFVIFFFVAASHALHSSYDSVDVVGQNQFPKYCLWPVAAVLSSWHFEQWEGPMRALYLFVGTTEVFSSSYFLLQ